MTLTTVELPQTDTRKYHHLTLPSNGLEVMLVQDIAAETSAAAVTVAAGQFQDPVDFPGLAHLVEHMVFLGSREFEAENEYDQFVSTHGGHTNAYTDLELTCFYCNIKSGNLEGALARFGASLSSPLFAASSLEREIQAVDSEHSNNRQSDAWRSNQLSHSLIGGRFHDNEMHHVFAHFGTGNMDVLLPGDDKNDRLIVLREQVVAFYERYYKASAMKLVILGPNPLEELEEWANTYFGRIPAGEVLKEPLSPLPKQPCMALQWVPVRDSRTLTLQWILPELRSHYRSKPGHVLSHVLGHEGPGTLLYVLKEELHWAHELSADNISSMTSAFTVFNLIIELTPAGLDNVSEIIAGVYKYITLMQDLPDWVYDEQELTAELQFRFLSKTEPEDTASQLAVNLQYYAPEHAISGPHKIYKHETALVRQCLDCFTRDNMFILLSSKYFETDRVDPWYGTQFKVLNKEDVTETFFVTEPDAEWFALLCLPTPNDMLATHFDCVASPDQCFENPEATPRCLLNTNICRLWYKPDLTFRMPKVNVMVMFRTPLVYCSPQNALLAAMWTELIQEFCNSFSYVASMAGLHCYFQASTKAIEMTITGYNHKVGVLIERVVETIKCLPEKISDPVFKRVAHKLEQRYLAFMMGSPYRRAMNGADLCLDAEKWNVEDRLELLQNKNLSPNDMIQFHRQLMGSFLLEALVHGNAEPSTALEWINRIVDAFQPSVLLYHPLNRVVEIPNGEILYGFPCHNPDDNNNSVLSYYQVGVLDLRGAAILKLTQHLMQEPAFFQLRTSEQLGYLVHTSVKTNGEHVKGLMVLIQSESFHPDYLNERIEAFLPQFRKSVVEMTAVDFQKNALAVSQGLLEKPKNLGEESSRHWDAISNKTYYFTRSKDLAALVGGVSKQEILQFLDKYILPSPYRRKLSVRVYGASNRDMIPNVIIDPKQFGRCQALYPTHHDVDIVNMMMN